MVVVAGHNDQYTKGNKRVKENGYVGLVVSSTNRVVLSSNIITRLVEMTVLSHSTL